MTVRYAIIGAGMMGQEHIRNLALVPGASVTAIADPHDGMREEASALAGDQAQSFSSHGDLLSADMSDAFVVASPNHTHKGVLADLTAAGKPILVEKPLCTTQADCAEAAALAEAAGVPLWVAMEYRYMPAIARLIEDVEKGAAGTLHMISIREHRFPFLDKVGDWNRFQANTGGTMVEKCCHFFDLMRLILKSEPVRVYASGAQSVNHLNERYDGAAPDILDNAFVVVDFASGARGMLELSMFAEGSEFQESVAVIGDTAKIEALVPGPGRFRPADQSTDSLLIHSPRATKKAVRIDVEADPRLLRAGDHHGSTYFQHLAFNAMVREGGAPGVSAQDGLKAVAMGEAAEVSARNHMPMNLSFED